MSSAPVIVCSHCFGKRRFLSAIHACPKTVDGRGAAERLGDFSSFSVGLFFFRLWSLSTRNLGSIAVLAVL